jgi:hypothetical protein
MIFFYIYMNAVISDIVNIIHISKAAHHLKADPDHIPELPQKTATQGFSQKTATQGFSQKTATQGFSQKTEVELPADCWMTILSFLPFNNRVLIANTCKAILSSIQISPKYCELRYFFRAYKLTPALLLEKATILGFHNVIKWILKEIRMFASRLRYYIQLDEMNEILNTCLLQASHSALDTFIRYNPYIWNLHVNDTKLLACRQLNSCVWEKIMTYKLYRAFNLYDLRFNRKISHIPRIIRSMTGSGIPDKLRPIFETHYDNIRAVLNTSTIYNKNHDEIEQFYIIITLGDMKIFTIIYEIIA